MIMSQRTDCGILVQHECGRGLDEEWHDGHEYSDKCELVRRSSDSSSPESIGRWQSRAVLDVSQAYWIGETLQEASRL